MSDVKSKVDSWMKLKYKKSLEEMMPTNTPGYWEDIEPNIHQGHPLHGCLFCREPFRATYSFFDNRRDDKGRFSSPFRSWKTIRDQRP